MSSAIRTLTDERHLDRLAAPRLAARERDTGNLRDALSRLRVGHDLPSYVKQPIAASWERAIRAGLAPERITVPFDPDFDGTGPLVSAARPVLDQLALDLAGTRVGVVLSNPQGQLVDRRVVDPALLDAMDAISLAPGCIYAEDVVGTNGIGTALAQRAPSAVEGEEHFADALTAVACAGAPITDPRSGRVAGVIDLTCLAGDGSALMLPLAIRAAHEIEQRLVDDSGISERLMLQRFLQERRRAKGPLVFITDRSIITNAAADRLVAPDDAASLRSCATQLRRGDPGASCTIELSGGTTVAVACETIVDGGFHGDAILKLKVISDADSSGHGTSTFGWESLTPTERSVTELVAHGLTNKEAAERLFLSPHTVGFHLRSIYRKLGVRSRVDLTRSVLEHDTGPVLVAMS